MARKTIYHLLFNENTAPTDVFDPEQKKNVCCLYVLINAFHPVLNLKNIIIQRSFAYFLEELTGINYLSDDQMKFINLQILNQLKDIAVDESKRKCKNTMGQMFCIESAFVKKIIIRMV